MGGCGRRGSETANGNYIMGAEISQCCFKGIKGKFAGIELAVCELLVPCQWQHHCAGDKDLILEVGRWLASRSRDTWLKVLVVKSKLPERRYSIVWIGVIGPNSRSTSCLRSEGMDSFG